MHQLKYICFESKEDFTIQPRLALLCTSVKKSGTNGWNVLVCMMKFLHASFKGKLTLNAKKGIHAIKLYVAVAFYVHIVLKSHTGAVMKIKKEKEQALVSY